MPDIHMAVISSNVGAGSISIVGNEACSHAGGDRGEFQTGSACGLDPDARFIISRDNETADNFADDKTLEEVFGCMALLGTKGCGYEHQLLSVVASLAPTTTKNAGFLRKDAYLAVILITDEDDCSGPAASTLYSDPSFSRDQAASLRCSLVGHRCSGQPPPPGAFQTNPACVRGKLVDADPDKPGVQGECSVTQIVPAGGMKKEEVIPSCESAGGKRPCFRLVAPGAPDNSCREGWWVDVQRDQEPPGDTVERINCRTCVDIGGDSLAGCG